MINSNMTVPRLSCGARPDVGPNGAGNQAGFLLRFGPTVRPGVCDLLDRSRNAAQWCAEIRDIYHREQQPSYPEQMDVREQRQQAKNGHDLELQFLRFVRHALG